MNLLSGLVTIRNRKLPLTWNGEKAEHLANEHIKENHYPGHGPNVHPFLHIDAQQFARRGQLFLQQGKRFIVLAKDSRYPNSIVCVPLQHEGKFVLILTCYLEFNQTFDTVKKQKRIGNISAASKKKLISKTAPADFELSEKGREILSTLGFNVEKARQTMWLFLNGVKPKK